MTSLGCRRWLDDPDAMEAHARECPACAARLRELDSVDRDLAAVRIDPAGPIGTVMAARLPVAAWEGAEHRPWWLVFGVMTAVAILAGVAFLVVGLSPVGSLIDLGRALVGRFDAALSVARSMSLILKSAPAAMHLLLAVAFLAINALLIAMLRRGPRGYDVRSR